MPLIRPYHSPLSPFELYQRLYRAPEVSFFLDSPQYQAPDQCYSYLGANPFLELKLESGKIHLTGEKRGVYPAADLFKVIRKLLIAYHLPLTTSRPFFTGGMVGYFAYEAAPLFEKIRLKPKRSSEIPEVYFGFYRDLVVFDHKRGHYWMVGSPRIEETRSIETKKRKKSLPLTSNLSASSINPDLSRAQFEGKVRKAKEYIAAGDIYQANLSQRFTFDYDGDPLELYARLRAINPSPFSCFLKIKNTAVVSSSPERLVQKRGRLCETRPIAGTRPAVRAKAGNHRAKKQLLASTKERAEHIMLVDLERNDLGRVCDFKSVRVEEMMTTEKYSHVIHIVSKITGKLSRGKDGLDLIRAMFPGGTITGCPKIRCMEIIDELESKPRGLYTGSIGYMDFNGDLDFNIVIRTLVLHQGRGSFQVGAGIVHDSDPKKEYEETLHKGQALIEALRAKKSQCTNRSE